MVSNTLEERGKIYGSYKDTIKTRAIIMEVLGLHHSHKNNKEWSSDVAIAFGDIVMKLVRAAANPKHTDSLHDLAGYSTLLEGILSEEG